MRFVTQLSQRPNDCRRLSTKTASHNTEGARKPASILSRLSDRTQSGIHRNSATERGLGESVEVGHRKPRPRVTSFVSSRSAQQRDHAAEKWFTDVRELDIDNVNRADDLESLPRKKRTRAPKQHEMRPETDLNTLFASPPTRSAASLRLQSDKELGGDYASYLPEGFADPYRLPMDYARLVLGRNRHISLNAQIGALNIIEEAVLGRTSRQVV